MKPSWLRKVYPVLLVVLLTAASIASLVATADYTRAVMESQQDPETLAVLQQVFPEATFYSYDIDTEVYTVYNNGRNQIGYAFYGTDWGYISEITVLVGLEDAETIRGIYVTKQLDTPQYWKRLVDKNFFDQFNGLKVADCDLTRNGGVLDAVSMATYSSRGVIGAVQDALTKIEYID